jgi:hypothetical protein
VAKDFLKLWRETSLKFLDTEPQRKKMASSNSEERIPLSIGLQERGAQVILLVEAEEPLLGILIVLLQNSGYLVLAASNAMEALSCEKNKK